MFLAGLTGVYGFRLPILKRLHVATNPAWSDVGLRVSKFSLEILFLVLALPFLIASIRALIRREEPNKINRLITVALAIVWAYLLWNIVPGIGQGSFGCSPIVNGQRGKSGVWRAGRGG